MIILTHSIILPNKNLTLLHIASFYDSTECLFELLKLNSNVNISSADEYYPLHYAALSNSNECASILLSMDADPNFSPNSVIQS